VLCLLSKLVQAECLSRDIESFWLQVGVAKKLGDSAARGPPSIADFAAGSKTEFVI
jgi:hypothetical protein